ncbi:uncharacterized protein [Lepidochelys kempii]|uniref:uncharacterized protein isoform X1 n=1 Tax=Lepidochelys kempii TaxID=8472 RepID=UPI003C6F1C5A
MACMEDQVMGRGGLQNTRAAISRGSQMWSKSLRHTQSQGDTSVTPYCELQTRGEREGVVEHPQGHTPVEESLLLHRAAGHKRDPVWEYFNEDPLPVGETGMHAKCKQCNKEMHGLVSRMKQYHENCYFSGGSCVEDNERNMSEYAESSGESILNIQDSEDYPPSRSPSFFIVPELSANDSVSVTSCMSHSHSISPLVKRKKTPSSRNNHR